MNDDKAMRFLRERVAGVRMKDFGDAFVDAVAALLASDLPLDNKHTRQKMSQLLLHVHYRPRVKKRDITVAIDEVMIEQFTDRNRRLGVAYPKATAQEEVAKSRGRTAGALRKAKFRQKQRRDRK